MIRLYFNPRSRATIARWMLDECGAEYEIVHIDFQKGEHKRPEFLAVNPAGKLPALVDGETRVFENAAIGLYLGDRFPDAGLAPRPDEPERGRYLSLMVYSTAQLEPAMGDALLGKTTDRQRGWTDFEAAKDAIERELGDGPYLFGERFTLADILIGSMFMWKRLWDPTPERPRIEAYLERLRQRPRGLKFGE